MELTCNGGLSERGNTVARAARRRTGDMIAPGYVHNLQHQHVFFRAIGLSQHHKL